MKASSTDDGGVEDLLFAVKRLITAVCVSCCKMRRKVLHDGNTLIKGIVHFEIKIWYLSAYPKGIQDVGVFFSSVDPILMFLGQTVLVCQSYNGRYRSLSL